MDTAVFRSMIILILAAAPAAHADPYATEIVSSDGLADGYEDPASTLGPPALSQYDPWANNMAGGEIDISMVYGPWTSAKIASLQAEGYLTIRFDSPVTDDPRHPYGADFIIFGGAAFMGEGFAWVEPDTDMATYLINSAGAIFGHEMSVSVSQDGETWHTFTSPPAGGYWPTQAYSRWDPDAVAWDHGSVSDFTLPMNPALTPEDFGGLPVAQAIALYAGSGGGTAFDIGALGLDWIEYVKVEGPGNIDAFAKVSPTGRYWLQYAGNCRNDPVIDSRPAPGLDQPRWVATPDFRPSPASSPVVFDGKVYVYGDLYEPEPGVPELASCIAAFWLGDGRCLWQTPVITRVADSWSSPAVDPQSRCVLIASGQWVSALNADTGATAWATDLGSPVVNGSITVAEGRAFVSDFFDDSGQLFALNLGASDQHEPGEILWSADTGLSSGSTPAYYRGEDQAGDLVIVAACSGSIRAFDPDSGVQQWIYQVPDADGWWGTGGTFWGGVSVADGFVYASTYAFYGSEDNSYTYKLNALTGDFAWRTPSERTDSVPVICGDLMLLSGGVDNWGSAAKLEAFDKHTGGKLWEAAGIGGYTNTPAVIDGICYVGTMPEYVGDCYQTLSAIDLSLTPADEGFVVWSYDGAGGSPAYADGNIYSVGAAGLCAFGPPPTERARPMPGDATLDGRVDVLDLIFLRNRLGEDPGSGDNWQADVTGDGAINILDMIMVRSRLAAL